MNLKGWDKMDIGRDKWLGNLPDPFMGADGRRMTSIEQWPEQRRTLIGKTVPLLYGGMPPKPEVFRLTYLFNWHNRLYTYLIEAGTREKTVQLKLQLFVPEGDGPFPVVLDGDGCCHYMNDDVIKMINDRGYIAAKFDRTELAKDNYGDSSRDLGLYTVYPELSFGALAAWAWGYHRCVDAFERLDLVDSGCVAITGHSRGGKTTLLAAATDDRILFTQDNSSGAAGGGCFRYEQYADPEYVKKFALEDDRSERLADLLGPVPYWLGPDMPGYVGRETELPFDQHFLKAAVAPRWLLLNNTLDDIWANPNGAYQTYLAAKEVYAFLGAEDHIASVYRYGTHYHRPEDFLVFLDFIDCARQGRRFLRDNSALAIDMPRLYSWGE